MVPKLLTPIFSLSNNFKYILGSHSRHSIGGWRRGIWDIVPPRQVLSTLLRILTFLRTFPRGEGMGGLWLPRLASLDVCCWGCFPDLPSSHSHATGVPGKMAGHWDFNLGSLSMIKHDDVTLTDRCFVKNKTLYKPEVSSSGESLLKLRNLPLFVWHLAWNQHIRNKIHHRHMRHDQHLRLRLPGLLDACAKERCRSM